MQVGRAPVIRTVLGVLLVVPFLLGNFLSITKGLGLVQYVHVLLYWITFHTFSGCLLTLSVSHGPFGWTA